MLRAIFRRPYRPVAQTIYYAVVAILGAVLLIVGQSWAIGLFGLGCGGVLLMSAGASWRHRHPN
jgi:hypothetical protein